MENDVRDMAISMSLDLTSGIYLTAVKVEKLIMVDEKRRENGE